MAVLETRKVTKRFGGLVAVKEVDVDVEEGSIHSIIGPNGAGKTTLFNCISGFYAPEEGRIIFNGKEIQGFPPDKVAKMGIARTYQNIRLFKNMTVLENVLVGLHPHLTSWVIEPILGLKKYKEEEERGGKGRRGRRGGGRRRRKGKKTKKRMNYLVG